MAPADVQCGMRIVGYVFPVDEECPRDCQKREYENGWMRGRDTFFLPQSGPMQTITAPSRPVHCRQRNVSCHASKKSAGNERGSGYQEAWFKSTRAVLDDQVSTEGRRRVIKEYVEANRRANGGREREDLYTDNWDGDVYKGNPVNVLSVILAVSVLAPLIGLIFALQTYGTLWG